MLGFLRAVEVLQKQKEQVMKQMKRATTEEKITLQIVVDELNESINYLHLKINEFLIYMKNTDRKTYKVIMKHYFENMPWNYAVDDFDVDADAYRKSIERACKKYDSMSDTDKESYIK